MEEVRDLSLKIKRKEEFVYKHNKLFSLKEIFERIGYGFVTPQFINILFFHTGASLFLIGMIYGLKNLISALISSIANLYSLHHKISTRLLSIGGIIFGFSFLFIAFARVIRSPLIFTLALLAGSVGIVTYGELYKKIYNAALPYEKRNKFLKKIVYYGILISIISMLISGFIIDIFYKKNVEENTKIYGYLISFEITAFCFIISSFLFSKIEDKRAYLTMNFSKFIKTHFKHYLKNAFFLLREKRVFLLLITTSLAIILQIIGNAYYGIYIFNLFDGFLFGRFLNIAVIYTIGTLIGLSGYLFTKNMHINTGITPHILLSSLLIAILPFALVFNPHFLSITAAVSAMFIGSVILGSAHNILIKKIIPERTRELFYSTSVIFSFIPSLLLIIIGSCITHLYGMKTLFLFLGGAFVFIIAPLSLLLVIICERKQ